MLLIELQEEDCTGKKKNVLFCFLFFVLFFEASRFSNNQNSGSYNSISVWDLDKLECVKTVATPGGSVYCLLVSGNR